MLTRLRLKNFKSWADTHDVPIRPITGIFGANSSGKTSLLQALLLLKQTAASADRGLALHFGDRGSLVNLGDFGSVIHGHDLEAELVLELDWQRPDPLTVSSPERPNAPVEKDAKLGFSTHIRSEIEGARKAQSLAVPEMVYRVGRATFGMRRKEESRREYDLFSANTKFEFVRSQGRPWPLPGPSKCYGFPDQVRAYYQNSGVLSDLELALEEELQRIYYLGPLRAYPERTYTWAGAQPSDMGQAGDQAVDAILASRERGNTIARGRGRPRVTLEEYVAEWLLKLGLITEFRVEPMAEGGHVFQVKVRKARGGTEALITDVGFGVSQILPVIVLCFYVPEGSTVILEQPEIHLHPAVQSALADVIIDAHKKRGIQVIVESHSEHLLRRMQRRVAEEKLATDEIALYFCEVGASGSHLTPLDMNLFGQITNWPDEFFGDQFGELAATQKAVTKRAGRAQRSK